MNRILLPLFLICSLIHTQTSAIASDKRDYSLTVPASEEKLFSMSWEELLDVEITAATGSPKTIHSAPAVATVITAAEIERIGATTLSEVLETVPGLHVSPSPLSYFSPIWSVRGIHFELNPHVLLLINGIPFKNPYTGDRTQTFRMLVKKISRIEVIRGPGSAVHGADAFAGVINVITKDGEEIKGTEAGLMTGSFETNGAWVQSGYVKDGWDVSLTIQAWETGGDPDRIIDEDRFGSGPPSNTPVELDAWHEMIEFNLGVSKDEWNLHLDASLQDDFGGAGAIQAITEYTVDAETFLADLTYHKDIHNNWDLEVRLHYLYTYSSVYAEIVPPVIRDQRGNPIVTSQEGGLEAITFFKGLDRHRLRLSTGASYIEADTRQFKNWGDGVDVQFGPMVDISDTDYVFMEDQIRKLWFISLQDEWNFTKNWELTAGIRYDEYSDFGGTANPRLALVWDLRTNLTTKLLYGQAFRTPSFAELYAQNNISATGNSDLDPEKIESLEFVIDYHPRERVRTNLTLFTYKANNLIEFVPPSPQTAENNNEQTGHGLEFELDWLATDRLRVLTNFAWQRSEDKNLDARVPDAPEYQYYLNPHWEFLPHWSLDGQLIWVGGRHRHPDDPRDEIDDYTTVNLTLRRKLIAKHLDIAVGAKNIFNEDVREPSPYDSTAPQGAFIPDDYPMDGQNLWMELRYRF